MKPISKCVFLLLLSVNLSGQWKIGPKLSIGKIAQASSIIDVIPMDNFQSYNLEFTGSSSVTSIGFMAYNDLGPFFLQSELMATTYGLDFTMAGYKAMDFGQHTFHEQYYTLEIPFVAGVKINNFKVGLGPVTDFSLDMDSEFSKVKEYKNTTKTVDFGFQGLVGYNYGIFHLDVKYVNKFSSITDGFALGYDVLKYNKSANRLMLGIGITL